MLTIGKIRGLQQISSPDGILAICAMDHRESLKGMIAQGHPERVSYQDMVDFKLELCQTLAPHATAVLLDPNYGVAQCISAGVLPGGVGLLISTEASGYLGSSAQRRTVLQPGWSVEKIRRVGASAAKLLLYYRPDLPELAADQLAVARTVAEECIRYDLPCVVECVAYLIEGEKEHPPLFSQRKPNLVIQTAKDITALPIDILKAEFPADLSQIKEEVLDLCHKLNEASRTPWVLLSAGVNFDTFYQQVKLACQAGASGFMGGRAIWQEATTIGDRKERKKFLSTVAADRVKRLVEIATKYATPWYKKRGLASHHSAQVSENWYQEY